MTESGALGPGGIGNQEDRGLAPHVKKQGGTTCGAKPAKTDRLAPGAALRAGSLCAACYR